MSKITLLAENCWVIRSPSISRPGRYLYHVVANQWSHSPMAATIYRLEDDAKRMIDDMRYYDRIGFAEKDHVEPVPLEGAILTCGLNVMRREGNKP